jgi:hypothetical protein
VGEGTDIVFLHVTLPWDALEIEDAPTYSYCHVEVEVEVEVGEI